MVGRMPLAGVTWQALHYVEGFRRLGPAILELVDAPGAERPHLWGLTVIVSDLGALADRLGDDLGPVKPAVQPERPATVRPRR